PVSTLFPYTTLFRSSKGSSPLYAPDYLCSLFFLPFNTNSLLSQHREAVLYLLLKVDTDGPTIIFYTARIKQALSFTAHFGKMAGFATNYNILLFIRRMCSTFSFFLII